jgi:uncharacterized repeat protein (TIGR02543 family)
MNNEQGTMNNAKEKRKMNKEKSEDYSKIVCLTFFTFLFSLFFCMSCTLGTDIETLRKRVKGEEKPTVTVTFDKNKATSGTVPKKQTVSVGSSITLPEKGNLARTGYVFNGWNTKADGTGINYPAGITFTPTGDVTLYAKWDPIGTTYTVTFNANGATGGTVPVAQQVTAGSSITLPSAGGLSRTGNTFGGWNTLATGDGTNFSAGSSYTPAGDVTLYALWDINWYTVTFNADGGIPAPVQQSIAHGGTVTQPGPMNKTGYGFGGWYKEADLTNLWDFATDTVTGNITLYAYWDTNFFTVTFDANGGIPVPAQQDIAHNGKVIEPPETMTKTGYTFDGWYTDNIFEYKWNFAEHTVTQNRTLYAKWNPVPVSGVTLNKTVLTLTEGESERLIATVHPADALNQSVSWGTGDSGKATVAADGTVTAVSAGTAVITVITADGDKTATCTVTVQKPVRFTITFAQITDAASNIIVDKVISLNNEPKTVELRVDNPAQYTRIEWHIPAVYKSESGNSFILDSANPAYNSIGEHFLTLEVWKGGKPYNKTIIFTVTE